MTCLQGSPWSDPPPAGNGTPRAVDAALQPSEVPAKTDNAEVLPPLPAEIQPENSHANEDAAASLLASLGVTSASCPIFGAPLQQSSAAMPTMSDDEDLMFAPGAANLSDGPILGDYNVQPSSVSTGMQLVSGPDTITATQESKTHQPTGVTSKVCTLNHFITGPDGSCNTFHKAVYTYPVVCTCEV